MAILIAQHSWQVIFAKIIILGRMRNKYQKELMLINRTKYTYRSSAHFDPALRASELWSNLMEIKNVMGLSTYCILILFSQYAR